ncbi:glutathione S-transferase A4-like [Sceloporus undulatus]|uniref:glutathione S-transferase A4-like n=1 Tax=Sceloporus undulatus TaxID=8520 RepID=UPI001C4B0A0D|nr:glutathione S-transferase A4-like [Sceloporus undulatus]XP_042301910.1 glutathione S-transferase A4-like [Sceloporus undulatus]XP_042301911.1 glutathione S-transferase A4-like [Sceloporus undulatus]XP_042301912.1 glutathione S-transferase A4-like [Sceloporus undulatus]
MAAKPKLYYFNGRGRMEPVRWLLAAAGVEFEEVFLERREQYEKLLKDGFLLFQQVPMVEIDGMRLVQTRAILSYIAAKHNLYGKDLKERALIDMYVEGTTDLMTIIRVHFKLPAEEKEKNLNLIIERATKRYFPVYEKILKDNGQHFLLGNQFTWADVQLIEAILMTEEKEPTILSQFPLLQAFKARICDVPTIKKFLQPGSQRKPPPDEKFLATANRVFNRK